MKTGKAEKIAVLNSINKREKRCSKNDEACKQYQVDKGILERGKGVSTFIYDCQQDSCWYSRSDTLFNLQEASEGKKSRIWVLLTKISNDTSSTHDELSRSLPVRWAFVLFL